MSGPIIRFRPSAVAALCLAICVAAPAASAVAAPVTAKRGPATKHNHKQKHRKSSHAVVHGQPGATGPRGPQGPQGPQGAQGPQGPAGANGTALEYAKVTAAGVVVASGSKNITSANISTIPKAPGYYCISNLPFSPGTANATAAFVGSDTDAGAQVELASADPNFAVDTGCAPTAQALVFTHQGGLPKAEPFYVSFS